MTETKNLPVERPERGGLPAQSIKVMADQLKYIEEFKTAILHKGIDGDYAVIPGTQKPTLLKPGMEKLVAAFSLAPVYEVNILEQDHFRKWKYTVGNEERETTGFYNINAICSLLHKKTNEVWASAVANCNSSERGKETQPLNTIIKIAEKRALGLAVQNATMSSHIFDVDLDDLDDSYYKKNRSSKTAEGFELEMKSKFGTIAQPSKCKLCGKAHVVTPQALAAAPEAERIGLDDTIVLYNGTWGAKSCALKKMEPKDDTNEPGNGNDEPEYDENNPPPPTDSDMFGA